MSKPINQAFLAEMILRDVQQLKEKAQGEGDQ
jgi:hypothetical protein